MKAKILIRCPEIMKENLRDKAAKQGFTLNHMLVDILWDWLKQQEKIG